MIWYWLQKSSKESTWTHIWQIVLLIWSSFLTHFTIDQTFTCTGGRFGFCAFSTTTTKPWQLSFSTWIYLVLTVQSSNECNRIHFFVCTIDLSNKYLFLLANAFVQITSTRTTHSWVFYLEQSGLGSSEFQKVHLELVLRNFQCFYSFYYSPNFFLILFSESPHMNYTFSARVSES